ncbi:hypothetical protein [Staphylococcus phage vB_StaM_SA1]|nr:hypothetical protein [Staphylococcus phage vB_StaM_SA1]
MTKKIDYKYTILKKFIEEVQKPLNEILDQVYNMYIDNIDDDQEIELHLGYSINNGNENLLKIINGIETEKDFSDFKEILNSLNDLERYKMNFMYGDKISDNPSETLHGFMTVLNFYNFLEKDPDKIHFIKDMIGKNSKEYIKKLDKKDLLERVFYRDSRLELFTDPENNKGELYKLTNNFNKYSLFEHVLSGTLLGNIIKGRFTNFAKINFNTLIDTDHLLKICPHFINRSDDAILKELSEEIIEIYESYQFLLNELKSKPVKEFKTFIEEKLPKFKLEKFEVDINDILTQEKMDSEYQQVSKDLKTIDGIIKKLKLV